MVEYPLFLRSKHFIPEIRPNTITRDRLLDKLSDSVLHYPLTLISAPAGFGKTVLVSEWAHSGKGINDPVNFAWISLDTRDNDPEHFSNNLLMTMHPQPSMGGTVKGLREISDNPIALQAAVNFVLEAAENRTSLLVLVLDDYHLIQNEMIHRMMIDLVEHAPSGLRLIILTREDPPIALPRLRAGRMMGEIRAAELRFTRSETACFLGTGMGLQVTDEDLSVLDSHIEGWIAGLQLAALSMQTCEDIPSFIKQFTGSHRYFVDYLSEEILGKQTEEIKEFLLKTSILERLNGDLCDALTGQNNGFGILNELERKNLFIISLDNSRHWFRYHHLFGNILRFHLVHQSNIEMADLHRRASQWYEKNAMLYDAIQHAFHAQDFETIVRIIGKSGPSQVSSIGTATMQNWIDGLPEKMVKNPTISLIQAWMYFVTTNIHAVEPCLQSIELELIQDQSLSEDQCSRIRGEIATCRACTSIRVEDVERALAYSKEALGHLGGRSPDIEVVIQSVQGDAHFLHGNLKQAIYSYQAAVFASQKAKDKALELTMEVDRGRFLLMQGELDKAERVFQGIQKNCQLPGRYDSVLGKALVEWGEILRLRNQLPEAQEMLEQGIRLLQGEGFYGWLTSALMSLARLKQTQGEAQQTVQMLERAEQAAFIINVPRLNFQVNAIRALMDLRLGCLQSATAWAEENLLRLADDLLYSSEMEKLVLAQIIICLLQQGQKNPQFLGVRRMLEYMLAQAEKFNRLASIIEILLLLAQEAQLTGRLDAALEMVERALILEETRRAMRVWLDGGPAIISLVRFLQQKNPQITSFGWEFLTNCRELPNSSGERPYLLQPLSSREQEVLILLLDGATNGEIANTLYISENTVKKHVSNILIKMDVSSRRLAVRRAVELGLVKK